MGETALDTVKKRLKALLKVICPKFADALQAMDYEIALAFQMESTTSKLS